MKVLAVAIAIAALPAIAFAQAVPVTAPATPAATAAAVATSPAAAAAVVPAASDSDGKVEESPRGKYRMACAADVAKFCADIEKGKGKKRACLEQHQSEITTGCKDALAERAAAKSKG